MRVAQLIPSVMEHDAMSNYVLQLDEIMAHAGVDSRIFASLVESKVYSSRVYLLDSLRDFQPNLLIYHMGIGDPIGEYIQLLGIPYIIYYHNITPSLYFQNNWPLANLLEWGRRQLSELAKSAIAGMAASEYSKKEMVEVGYKNCYVFPIIIDTQKIALIEDINAEGYGICDGKDNLCFVGRISPHKKQDDLIRVFKIYKEHYNSNSRLFLVGSIFDQDYFTLLNRLLAELDLCRDVEILGLLDEVRWKAYYRHSRAFVSMSEHEGFCVPLLEAHYFHLPVVAYDGGAVAEVMGGAGILIKDKTNLLNTARSIDMVVSNTNMRNELISKGTMNLERFKKENQAARFIQIISGALQ
mgnify:CR=1 FL=1